MAWDEEREFYGGYRPQLTGKRTLAELQAETQHYHALQHSTARRRTMFNSLSGQGLRWSQTCTEEKMMSKLRDLEKELFDDEESDVVSVVTNSDWSETTIQNLFTGSPNTTFVSPSPSSSTSSTSSSSTSSSPRQVLVEAASSMAEGDKEKSREILAGLVGGKHRVAGFFAGVMLGAKLRPPETAPLGKSLYDISICFKLSLLTANQFILESVGVSPGKIHVVDFSVGDGGFYVQYTHLLQALAARGREKMVPVKITTFSEISGRLKSFAERIGVDLELACKPGLTELTRESLGCEDDEVLVANFGFYLHLVPDESVRTDNPRDALLRRVKKLNPKLVVLIENEMNANTAGQAVRVGEVCEYCEALFESFDSVVQPDDPDRVRLEDGLLRRMANSVVCNGPERVQRWEMFGKWRARFGMAGFKLRPSSPGLAESLQARVNSGTRGVSGFTVREESGGICLGWKGRSLAVASAWL